MAVATLHVLQGPDKGRTYQTTDEPALIGRISDQIQLTDDSISRRHAELTPQNGAWVITDLNSSNGTYVNGQRIVTSTRLKHGDQIKVGGSLLVFTGSGSIAGFSGPPGIRDPVDLDLDGDGVDSSILQAIDAAADSVILQPPETADAVAAWNVVYEVAEMIGTIDSVPMFLERIADTIFNHLIVDRLVLMLRETDSDELVPQVVRFRKQEHERRARIVTSRKIIDHVLESHDGVLCANAMTDDRFSEETSHDSIHRFGLRSVICVPIISREQVHGVLHLDCSMSHHTYTPEQLRLAVAIGKLTGMAIENTRLLATRVRTERLAAAGEAVAYVSHHIRNILQGLQSGAEVVELGIKRDVMDTVRSGWHIVRRNLDRTYRLTLNMLTFSKQRKPTIQITQLNKIIEDVISLVQRVADDKAVVLLTDLEDIPAIPLDPNGIHQVLYNVVTNALDAVAAKTGRVNIRTTYDAQAGLAIASISDNGPGISKEDIEDIFDPFHSTKGQGGTGLGLAAAKKIVAEHEGTIEVETTEGGGATFCIKLRATHMRLADSDQTHGPA